MYLLVTTPRFVLGYDTSGGNVDVLATGSRYYGVPWDLNGDNVALTHGGYEGQMEKLLDYAMADTGYMTVGSRKSWPFLNSPHQALWIDERSLAVTNTGRNAVARLSVDDMSVVQARYDDAMWDRYDVTGATGSHYNSVFYDGEHVYFVAHNFTKTAFIVKAQWPTLELVERIPVPGAFGIHNLWIDDARRWLVCDSHRGALVDALTAERLWDCRGEGYTRGLAANDDVVIVGHSEKSIRDKREYTASGLWMIDRATMELRDFVFLGHFGGVHEIRIADEPDACHHGRPLLPAALASLKDSRRTTQREMSERARVRIPDPKLWRPELGTFVVEEGRFVAKDGEFALMTQRGTESFGNGRVSVRLHVRNRTESDHAALVVRYGGPEDLRMYAAIFQCKGPTDLAVSIWIEDGGWSCIGTAAIPRERLAGINLARDGLPVALKADGKTLRAIVRDETVLSVTNANLASGAIGLRTIGTGFAFSQFVSGP